MLLVTAFEGISPTPSLTSLCASFELHDPWGGLGNEAAVNSLNVISESCIVRFLPLDKGPAVTILSEDLKP